MSGVEESPKPRASSRKLVATVFRGILYLPPASGVERKASSVLLDIGGRKVMDLHTGANDVSRLAPGVYFVREEPQAPGLKPEAIRKVIITR
jgi:hypothetical protein